MEVIWRKWWIPLVPVSYYSAYKLTETPPGHHQSDFIAPNQPQKITEDQFKKGHLFSEFLRLIRGRKSDVAGELQTSIVRYEEKSPNPLLNRKLQVDLVGVVHMGDQRYYQNIQNHLRRYDCVLFEGVGNGKSTDVEQVPACNQLVNPHSQEADEFGFVHQGSVIKRGQNWKHADLPLITFLQLKVKRQLLLEEIINRLWKEREKILESTKIKRITKKALDFLKRELPVYSLCLPLPAFVPLITYLTCLRNGPNAHDIDKLEEIFKLGLFHCDLGLFHCDVENTKFTAASILVYEYDKDFEGDTNYMSKAVIIRERNKFAMEVLKETIAEGKTSIAMLYGAGHMPDFHKRLVQELDMVPVSVEWYTAWSIKEGPKSKLIHPLLDKFLTEYRPLILGTLIFSFLLADLWAWRTGFGYHYWVASWIFRLECFFQREKNNRRRN